MIILLTNDDGIDSPGLWAMKSALESIGKVWVFASSEDYSGSSHSITLTHSIRVVKVGEAMYKVDGTPADCVNIAINGIMPQPPDIVVSGINIGENVGDDILYSGTFGGAIEGALLGCLSFAVSCRSIGEITGDLRLVGKITSKIIEFLVKNNLQKQMQRTVVNINFPYFRSPAEIKGVKFGKLCKRVYGERALHFQDPRGRDFWFIGGKELKTNSYQISDLDSLDVFILDRGYISVTFVQTEFKVANPSDESEKLLSSLVSEFIKKEASQSEEIQEEP